MTLARQLRELRLRRGWTQERLAEESGVSVRTVRNLESGKIRNPRRGSVDLLLGVLDSGAAIAYTPVRAWYGQRPPAGDLIGRESELDRLVLDAAVTVLTGPGGVGKTRLALAVADRLAPRFADSVAVISLAGIRADDPDPWGAVRPLLDRNASRLVVLDNAEHLPELTAGITSVLRVRDPQTRVLITSRKSLNCAAHVVEVTPLEPEAALSLFLARAATACPGLPVDTGAARDLCDRLGGLPRLIEFAAGRLRTVSVGTLAASGMSLLSGPAEPTAAPHQRSAAESVQWSLALLDPVRRAFLDRLAELGPVFGPEDVELSFLGTDFFQYGVLGLLGDLVEASLVRVHRGERYSYSLFADVAYVVGTKDQNVLGRVAFGRRTSLRDAA